MQKIILTVFLFIFFHSVIHALTHTNPERPCPTLVQFNFQLGKGIYCQGEQISRDHFVIVTNPVGHESEVDLSYPGTADIGSLKARAELICKNGGSVKTADYTVVASGTWIPVDGLPLGDPGSNPGKDKVEYYTKADFLGSGKTYYRVVYSYLPAKYEWKIIGAPAEGGSTFVHTTSQSTAWHASASVAGEGGIDLSFVSAKITVTLEGGWETKTEHTMSTGPGAAPYYWRYGHYQKIITFQERLQVFSNRTGYVDVLLPDVGKSIEARDVGTAGETYHQTTEKKCPQ